MKFDDLKTKYDISDVELFNQSHSSHKIIFQANKLKQIESNHINGYSIRTIKNKKIGSASCYGELNLESLCEKAISNSAFSDTVSITLPEKINLNENDSLLNKDLTRDFINQGKEIIDEINKKHSDILIDISFDLTTLQESTENSSSLQYSYSSNLYSFSASLRETKENNFVEIFTAVVESEIPDIKSYINDSIKYYELSKKSAKARNGCFPVLFTSKAVKELIEIIELALNGKQVNQKSSPWFDSLGKNVLSKNLTIKQDPSFGYMKRSIDHEGVEIKPLILINKGVLENFYFDLLSASKHSKAQQSSGNGFRNCLNSHIEPALLNLIIEPGNNSMDKIIKNINYGILVDQTMGGLSTNISGDISVNVDLGFLIENGEIIGRVKDTMVSGNIYKAFNNVIELSNDLKQHWSNIYCPDILFDGFTVTSG